MTIFLQCFSILPLKTFIEVPSEGQLIFFSLSSSSEEESCHQDKSVISMKDHPCNIYCWTDVRIITGSPSVTMAIGTRSFISKQCGHTSDVSLMYHLPTSILGLPIAITSQGFIPTPIHPNPTQSKNFWTWSFPDLSLSSSKARECLSFNLPLPFHPLAVLHPTFGCSRIH